MNNCRTLTFIICFTAALCRVCDEGWRYSPHSRKCYKLFTRPMTWTEAEFHCRMQRSNQLSIHNSRENRFFKEIARDVSEIWLGSAKFSELIGYEWSDKTSYNFRGWKNGRAPVIKSTQACTKMNVTNGEWFQSCCRKPAPYICQKNPQTVNYASNKQNDEAIAKNSGFEQLRFLLRK